jgi:predicted GIY-YIG superfamily endonuclease
MYTLYTITCQQNGRVYAGYTTNVHKRWLAHTRNPPIRMRGDVIKYHPFEDNFTLHVNNRYYSIKGAKAAEKAFIASHQLLTDKGYNLLRGSPGSSRLFWTMHNHGKLRNQCGRMATLLPQLFNA